MSSENWFFSQEVFEDTTILIATILNVQTWDEYHIFVDEMFSLASGISGKVDVIFDTQNSPLPSITPLGHFRKTAIKWQNYPNIQSFIIVLEVSYLLEPFANLSLKMVRVTGTVEYARTVEAAIKRIQNRYLKTT